MALQDEITRIKQAKADIKSSIEAKGGSVGDGTIDTYASAIDNLPSGGGDLSEYFEEKAPNENFKINNIIKKAPMIDMTGITSVASAFADCISLEEVPSLDTSEVKNFQSMFYNCKKLTSIPLYDTSSGTNFGSMFYQCKSINEIPEINTSLGASLSSMFQTCSNLTKIPELDFSKATNIYNAFSGCTNLVDFGGIKNVGMGYSTTSSANYYYCTVGLGYSKNLTHNSLMNVINKLYDIKTKGCNVQKLELGSTNLAKLTAEEIAIATNKGWAVS